MVKRFATPATSAPALLPDSSVRIRLERLIAQAILAPSTRNTQPWGFSIEGRSIYLFADRTRALPTADADGRELVLSCGAALFYLRLAARQFGEPIDVSIRPSPDRTDLLASVTLLEEEPFPITTGTPAAGATEDLFDAIPRRRTQRRDFMPRIVPAVLIERLRDAVADEGALLMDLGSASARELVSGLVSDGARRLGHSEFYRDEIREWTIQDGVARKDGIPVSELNPNGILGRMRASIFSPMSWGRLQARRQAQLARRAPLLVLIASERDDVRSWMDAGQALGRVLLTAAASGLSASFLNQPLQVAELRWRLRDALLTDLFPQVILRIGYGELAAPTPRRDLSDVRR